jgi:hypothetical protein
MHYHEYLLASMGRLIIACLQELIAVRSKAVACPDLHPTPPITNPTPLIAFSSESAPSAKVAGPPRRYFLPSSGIEQVTRVPLLIPFTSSDAPIRLAR